MANPSSRWEPKPDESRPGKRQVHITCPHCRNAIAVVQDPSEGEVVCPSCGSTFRIDQDQTVVWKPEKLPRLGKYELLEVVGRGAFGTVYKAMDLELDRVVAVKVPRSGCFATHEDEERFVREARSVARLNHPGVIPVHDVGHSEDFPFIVTEYVEGVTLADALTAHRFNFDRAAHLVADIADALEHAHQRGVIHRDLKPSNVMLPNTARSDVVGCRDNAAGGPSGIVSHKKGDASAADVATQPRLMDFGLALREDSEVTVTMEGQVLGTPAYMSPEQARGDSHLVDGRCDVYSLGVILYQLIADELPFRGNPRMIVHQLLYEQPRRPRQLDDHIPRDLETICLKAMSREPNHRYQSAREMAEDLRRFLCGEPVQARPYTVLAKTCLWCRRPERVHDAGAIALFLAIAITCWTVLGGLFSVMSGYSEDVFQAVWQVVAFILVFGLPAIIVALGTLRRMLTALWLGLGISAAGIAFSLVWINQDRWGLDLDFGGAYSDAAARFPVFGLCFFLTAILFSVYSIALVAYYSNRNTMRWYQTQTPSTSRALP